MQMTWALSDSGIIDQTCVLVQYLISDLDIEQVHLDMLQYKLPCGSGSINLCSGGHVNQLHLPSLPADEIPGFMNTVAFVDIGISRNLDSEVFANWTFWGFTKSPFVGKGAL